MENFLIFCEQRASRLPGRQPPAMPIKTEAKSARYRLDADGVHEEHAQRQQPGPGMSYLDLFKSSCKIDVIKVDDECMEFDLCGVDASLANALRRIMLSEVSVENPGRVR